MLVVVFWPVVIDSNQEYTRSLTNVSFFFKKSILIISFISPQHCEKNILGEKSKSSCDFLFAKHFVRINLFLKLYGKHVWWIGTAYEDFLCQEFYSVYLKKL